MPAVLIGPHHKNNNNIGSYGFCMTYPARSNNAGNPTISDNLAEFIYLFSP
jgi:hypothetical protein